MKSNMSRMGGLALVVFCVMSQGCTRNVVIGRYAEATCELRDGKHTACYDFMPQADVSVVTIPTAPNTTTTSSLPLPIASAGNAGTSAANPSGSPISSPTNLPERALAMLISRLSDHKLAPTAKKELLVQLATPFKAPTDSKIVDDRTRFRRTIITTVAKTGRFNPSDRLEAVDIAIDPIGARITSWDTAATLYTTINAGTLQLTQAQNVQADLTLSTPTPVGSQIGKVLGITGGGDESRVETLNALNQVENLTISVTTDGSMRIHRQGGIGVDLTGNVLIRADIDAISPDYTSDRYVFSVSGDYVDQKTKRWVDPHKLALNYQKIIAPLYRNTADSLNTDVENIENFKQSIMARATLKYTVRHVIAGDDTFEDRDDYVIFNTIEKEPVLVELIPGRQVSSSSIAIWTAEKAVIKAELPVLSGPTPLCFDTYEAASVLTQGGADARPRHGDLDCPERADNPSLAMTVPVTFARYFGRVISVHAILCLCRDSQPDRSTSN